MDYTALARDLPQFIGENIKAIYLILGVTSAMIALVMFLPRYNALAVGDWVKYFGLAFAVTAVQYIVPLIVMIVAPKSWRAAILYFKAFCSALNSLLFLATAISLLGRANLFPLWSVIFALIAALTSAFDDYALKYSLLSWARLPDALMSAFCLAAVGITIGSNISFHWKKGLAFIAVYAALIYAALLILYGFHPMMAKNDRVQSWIGHSEDKIQKIQVDSQGKNILKNVEKIRSEETLRNLDALAFTVSLPLRLGLFIPAYILLIFILKTSEQSNQLLDRLGEERLSYLSGPDLVQVVGEQLKSDKVELSFLVPGPARRLASFTWRLDEVAEDIASLKRLDEDPYVAEVINDGKVRIQLGAKPPPTTIEQFITEDRLRFTYSHLTAKARAVLVPIKYSGAAIGCLRVEQDRFNLLTGTAIRQAKFFARLLALHANFFRQIAALDQISYRCNRLQVERCISDSKEAVTAVVNIIDEILSPLAVGMFLEIGFKQRQKVVGDNLTHMHRIYERWEGQRDHRKATELMRIPFTETCEALETYEAPLITNLSDEAQFHTEYQTNKNEGTRLGNFIFVARGDKDAINKPTLGMFYLHRKAISSILSDTILHLARDVHRESLKQFSLALSLEYVGVDEWFEALEKSAKAAELLWVVSIDPSTNNGGEANFLSEDEHIALLGQVMKKHKRKIEADIEATGISLVQLSEPLHPTNSVIFLRLPKTGRLVSFGIERPGFGVELDFDSPWKAFLLALCDLADSALDRILRDAEFRRIQIQASQNQALATVAATTGTIIHQLVNMTRDQMSASSTLRASLRMGTLQTENERLKRIIYNMSESGRSMLELTQSITNITKVDDTRPCNLAKAVEHARELFNISIAQNGIAFKFQVDPNLMIDVPYYVAALALANLVSNAKDALKAGAKGIDQHNRRIEVSAEETQDENGNVWIHCYVMDTGPGVPEAIREKIFHLGFSTNQNSGGWGLYLVKRALRENGGNIELLDPGPNTTTFSIRFPKSKRDR